MQLLADELDQAVGLPDHWRRSKGGASRPEREQEADDREPPRAADRGNGGEAAGAGVEQGSEQQAGEDQEKRPGGLPGQEQAGCNGKGDQRHLQGDRGGSAHRFS